MISERQREMGPTRYDFLQSQETERASVSKAWLNNQKEAFWASINGAPLNVSLGMLVQGAVEYAGYDTRASFFLLNAEGTSISHITGMGEDYARAVGDFPVGPDSTACGLAAYLRQPIICPDVELDPTWAPCLHLAHSFDYRATWSFPIEVARGEIVGTFCMYSRMPRQIGPHDLEVANALTSAAAVIMARHKVLQERANVEQALRKAEVRKAFLLKLSDALRELADPAEIQFQAMRVLGQYLDVTRVQYFEIDATDEWMISAGGYTDGAPPILERTRLDDFGAYIREAFRAGHTLVVNDVTTDTRVSVKELAAYDALGFRAYIGIPLIKAGQFVASLVIHHTSRRDWTPEEVSLAEDTAQRTWAAVERARAEAALRASEEKYRSLFNALNQGYVENEIIRNKDQVAIDYRLLSSNGQYERVTGIPLEKALKASARELMPDLEPFWVKIFDHVVRTGQPERFEHEASTLGRWFQVHAFPLGGDRFAVLYDDITERKRADAVRRKNEKRKSFLLKLSEALRARSDEDAISNLAIGLLAEELGLDRCYCIYTHIAEDRADVTHQFTRPGFVRLPASFQMSDFPVALKQIFNQTLIFNDTASDPDLTHLDKRSLADFNVAAMVAATVRKGEKKPVWALVVTSATPRAWSTDEVVLVEEATERTWAALEWASAEKALRNADHRKNEFLALLAHELRNPLAAVHNTTQILLRTDNATGIIKSAAEVLNRQVDHMVRQVDDLLDVSRISQGKIELRKQHCELLQIVNNALEASRPLFEKMTQQLTTTLDCSATYVHGDPVRLTQVIGNLLNNASKFTPRGGSINLNIAIENSQVVIRVRDNGIGIAQTALTQVFNMFAQADKSLERSRDGLGLGLALVKNLVEMHLGTVEANSEGLNKGSEFIVRLPILCEPPTKQSSEAPLETTPNIIPRRILLADDNPDSATSLATLLAMMGHEIKIACDGVDAVKKASEFDVDFILLDISMPQLNGYDAAQRIRELNKGNPTIVALTGFGQEDDRQRSKEAGFDAHLVKPVNLAELTRLLAGA